MTARQNLSPAPGVGAAEKSAVASINTVQFAQRHNVVAAQAWRPNMPQVDAADLDDTPTTSDEVAIEKELTEGVLAALKACKWGTRVPAYSLSQRRVIETTQEIDDVVIEQILNHDGARVHLMAWLASEAGAAAALCIATGHAGANATGLLQARNGGVL